MSDYKSVVPISKQASYALRNDGSWPESGKASGVFLNPAHIVQIMYPEEET